MAALSSWCYRNELYGIVVISCNHHTFSPHGGVHEFRQMCFSLFGSDLLHDNFLSTAGSGTLPVQDSIRIASGKSDNVLAPSDLVVQEAVTGVNRIALHVGQHVTVDVEGHADSGVPKHLRHHLRMDTPQQQQRGCSIWESLVLAATLDESEGRVILLDEPASNLHLGLQHKLLSTLRNAPGQIFVTTHSQSLLPTRAHEFEKVLRLARAGSKTDVFRVTYSSQSMLQADKLEQELTDSSDVSALLFASGAVLVEGETEAAAIAEWFPDLAISRGKDLSDFGIEVYAVGGKSDFAFFIKFLHAYGVPWAVICDGDALVGKTGLWSAVELSRATTSTPSDDMSFQDLKAFAAANGVYTANESAADDFELIPEVKAFIDDPENNLPTKNKARDGCKIARGITCPPTLDAILVQAVSRLTSVTYGSRTQ
jgi:Overcoming lysogenization defect protein-like, TOPRIM domain/AAA domain, putative AbiEii toxin, Type IV TA system